VLMAFGWTGATGRCAEEIYRQGDLAVKAGFSLDSAEVLHGMPLFVSFRLVNRSDRVLRYPEGGDFRNPITSSRFVVTAVDATGARLKSKLKAGGMPLPSVSTVPVGGERVERLLVNQWLDFPAPGKYELTCRRKLILAMDEDEQTFDVKETFPLVVQRGTATQWRDVIRDYGSRIRNGSRQGVLEGTYALAEIDSEQVIPYLTASLSRGTYMNRLKAIEALGRYPGDLVARSLMIALRDPDAAVRREAGRVLRRLDGIENVFRVLGDQARSGTVTERRVAVEALAVTGDRRALPLLVIAMEDENSSVREAAVHGIGMLGFRDADTALKDAISSEDIGMRLAGMRGWGELYVSVRVEWLTDVLRQIRREGLEETYLAATLQILHRRSGHYGASALLSVVDFSDPDPRNTWNRQILASAEAIKGVPRLMAEYAPDRGRSPSARDIETNRKILEGYEQWYRAHPLP